MWFSILDSSDEHLSVIAFFVVWNFIGMVRNAARILQTLDGPTTESLAADDRNGSISSQVENGSNQEPTNDPAIRDWESVQKTCDMFCMI